MSSVYSRTVQCSFFCGQAAFVELPAPPRGKLERLIITQVDAHPEAATINIYDRRGACLAATDLNVKAAGTVVGSQDTDGLLHITLDDDHGLIAGARIELKNCDVPEYNAVHVVAAVPATDELVLDIAYAGPLTTENSLSITLITPVLWQTEPFLPTKPPVTHLVLTDTISAGDDKILFDLNRSYENRDNQDFNMRTRHSALWLEFITTGQAEPLVFEIAYTCRADTIV